MSKLLLLVQTESDVQHLPAAAHAILASPITGVWLVFSPTVTVNASEAASKLDGEIDALRGAERAAADRGDYEAAKGYKTQREGKELDRQKALRDAWKNAPAEERQRKTKEIFAPFGDVLKAKGMAVRITGHSDHYDRDQWVAMLNSLSGDWHKPFTPGTFLIAWPEAVETSLQQPVGQYPQQISQSIDKKNKEIAEGIIRDSVPLSRRDELETLHPMKLGPIMRSFGLDHDGLTRAQKIEAILEHEAKTAAPAPELAEY